MFGFSGCEDIATDNGVSFRDLNLKKRFNASMPSLSRPTWAGMSKRKHHDTGGRGSPGGSSTSSRKRREALKMKARSRSNTPMAGMSSSTSNLPEFNVSSIDFANVTTTPSTKASTASTTSTPTTLSRRAQAKKAISRMVSMSGMRGIRKTSMRSSQRSSSSMGLDAAGTSDTSIEGNTPPRRRFTRSSMVPEVSITPTSDGSSNAASPAASVRTMYRVNPNTGRPAQSYNNRFLSPRAVVPRTRSRFNHRRGSASPSPSPPAAAGFPRRTSSLRHSNDFPFNPAAAEPFDDDSDLYASNPSSPVSETSRLLPSSPFQSLAGAAAASSPALVGNTNGSSADSPPVLNKPLPTLPREATPPISLAPFADDDVFFDASTSSTATAAAASHSWPLPSNRQSVYGSAAAANPTLPGKQSPPLPPTPASRPVPSNTPALGPVPDDDDDDDLPTSTTASSNINDVDIADSPSPTLGPLTPTPDPNPSPATPGSGATDTTVRATVTTTTRDRAPSGSSELSLYGFHHYNALDERVLAARLAQIRAALGRDDGNGREEGSGSCGDIDNGGSDAGGDSSIVGNGGSEAGHSSSSSIVNNHSRSSSSGSSAAASIGDGFMPDDEDHIAPLLPLSLRRFASRAATNRDSVASVMTDATGMSFVTAVEEASDEEEEEEGYDDDDDEVEVDDEDQEGGAEAWSSGHQLLLSPTEIDIGREHVHDDAEAEAEDSLVVVSEAESSLVVLAPQEDSLMDAAEDEAEIEPDTFQLVSRDGTNTNVLADLGAVEEASSDEDSESEPAEIAKYSNPVNGHFPPQPGAGPNVDLILDQQGKIKWSPSYTAVPDPLWVDEPNVLAIKAVVSAHIRLIDLDEDDFEVEYFAEGSFNKLYTVRKASQPPGTGPEYIFRVCLPAYPWYKLESEVATMELVRMYTNIPVPKVYVFDSDAENPVGHEWMMMDKVKAIPFAEARETMTMEQKTELARTLADWMHQLSTLRFDKIGSIYRRREKPATSKSDFKVGPIVDQTFMADWRLEYKIHRGPYTSIEQFFRSLIDVNHFDALDPRQKKRSEYCAALDELTSLTRSLNECTSNFERSHVKKIQEHWATKPAEEKESRISALRAQVDQHRADQQDDELDTVVWDRPRYPLTNVHGAAIADPFGRVNKQCQALHFALPHLCGSQPLRPGSTVLHHWDISDSNILVDAAGAAVALVDWEQVHALPYSLIDPYPRAIADRFERSKPPPPLAEGASDDARAAHAANTAFYENFLLRAAYRERLERLGSPHLEAFVECAPDMMELLALARDADQLSSEARVEQLVERLEDEIGRGF